MYGVPVDLPLQPFVGQELSQIALGRFQTQLHFAGTGTISIEGQWELRDPNGALIDAETEHAQRDCYRIHRLIERGGEVGPSSAPMNSRPPPGARCA
jgi:hypothetical protein